MQSIEGKREGAGVQVAHSDKTNSTSPSIKVPDVRIRTAALLEQIMDLDPQLSNQERLQLCDTAKILVDCVSREQRRNEIRAALLREFEGVKGAA
jgi:hypothetical protein